MGQKEQPAWDVTTATGITWTTEFWPLEVFPLISAERKRFHINTLNQMCYF